MNSWSKATLTVWGSLLLLGPLNYFAVRWGKIFGKIHWILSFCCYCVCRSKLSLPLKVDRRMNSCICCSLSLKALIQLSIRWCFDNYREDFALLNTNTVIDFIWIVVDIWNTMVLSIIKGFSLLYKFDFGLLISCILRIRRKGRVLRWFFIDYDRWSMIALVIR